MNDILKQYGVNFSSPTGYAKHNRIDSNNEWLSLFIEDFYSVAEADRLLSGIDEIINENDTNGGPFDTQSMYVAIINSSNTCVYHDLELYFDDPEITPDYSLPTSDFRAIVREWRSFVAGHPISVKG